ncbi:MAG: TRAP transporter small permease subunit [Acetobacteraceae bacterium]
MLLSLERGLNAFSNFLMAIAGVAITLMMLHIAGDITAKLLLNQPIVATLEIVTWYYMVATVFLPWGYIQVHKKHLMVELFTMRMAPRNVAVLDGFVGIAGAIYVGILVWLTLEHAMEQTAAGEIQDATFFDLPVWPARWFLPIPAAVMALTFLTQGIRDLTYGFTGQGKPSTPPKSEMPVEEA